MSDQEESTGKIISRLPDGVKRQIGRTILDGLKQGSFTFNNPLATEGGDYTQGTGGYTQSGGGNHNQGNGDYNQSKRVGNLGRLDITDLAEIMGSIDSLDR